MIPGFYDRHDERYFQAKAEAMHEAYGPTSNVMCTACEPMRSVGLPRAFPCPNVLCARSCPGWGYEVRFRRETQPDAYFRLTYERIEIMLEATSHLISLADFSTKPKLALVRGWYWKRDIGHLGPADRAAVEEYERVTMARVWRGEVSK